ncbi:MFS transporter [Mycobacterium heidelbergense]|uniref:MFS-type drug efflux transporter P55 n=1 Tax=Mycobacterium heidelbergense TaxID=53376 RepID=A0A1X0DM33_MYCHE|nr:MFS transporter [Mycobacterium heidelbergense]MCV7051653.1 MFS transporter [Mycobacterium heidelbergense]ORA73456.1 MFS transporter [Mycobacterium heidelbergense]BBZ48349.1 putative triacylglyceride transporter [Mycobacterium heidelbergense]
MSGLAGRRVAIGAGSLAVLLGALDAYVVVTIMRDIMHDVGIPINQLQRITPIVTMYLLGYIAAMPLLGKASDRFGRKRLLQVSLATFMLGSVITALSVQIGNFDVATVNIEILGHPLRDLVVLGYPIQNFHVSSLHVLVVGRTVQGVASGALLPVTLALGADLWAQRNRAAVLGGIGAAQELGSVLGPLYGIFIVWLLRDWRDVFWINVPLTLVAMALIQISLPSHDRSAAPERIDLIGGVLLAITLGLAVIGLYNPNPDGKEALPSYGLPLVIAAAVAAVAFLLWERFARTRLIDPAGVQFRPFLAALAASFAAGAALMVTLVDVELFGQGVLGKNENEAAGMLLFFLVALPVGAVVGGLIATRAGDRAVTVAGLLIAAGGYLLISHWPVDLPHYGYDVVGLVTLPAMQTDLLIAGLGLGLVIGPLTSAALRVVPADEHGIASAAVVVARMTGMLIGVAALSAWGLYRFYQILNSKYAALPSDLTGTDRAIAQAHQVLPSFAAMYGEIFTITAIVCVVGALLGLLISGRHEHADEPKVPEEKAFAPAP